MRTEAQEQELRAWEAKMRALPTAELDGYIIKFEQKAEELREQVIDYGITSRVDDWIVAASVAQRLRVIRDEQIDPHEDHYRQEAWEALNPIEQGRYDDDPNPYEGTYSEE